ncbi:MAG: hypothetical protein CM15mP89_5650 [Gammaproteobacteria bacterium]|nr:MAG: hypothetical protein CM15mP89_5650 [Gammaproteobacteria bacterium]
MARSVSLIRDKTALPIAVGFGIKDAASASAVAASADAVVVGSALIAEMEQKPILPRIWKRSRSMAPRYNCYKVSARVWTLHLHRKTAPSYTLLFPRWGIP